MVDGSANPQNSDPEVARLREENRKRALERLKATKERLANQRSGNNPPQNKGKEKEKRPLDAISSTGTKADTSSQHRDGTNLGPLQPAKKFKNYIDYDFSKMKDTHGGFIAEENESQPQGMTLEEWKESQRINQAPTFLDDPGAPKCFECKTPVLDFKLYNIFKSRVCKDCTKKYPEKYSLLTKTECKEDYLLTDPELRDEELLPHMERPNPHKTTYTNMMLYLRYQVEEFAFKKWGSPEGLDAEYEKRVAAKKVRKEKKFLDKLKEMRKKTRAEAITKHSDERHEHEWSASTEGLDGMVSRRCAICGMTTQEIVF